MEVGKRELERGKDRETCVRQRVIQIDRDEEKKEEKKRRYRRRIERDAQSVLLR